MRSIVFVVALGACARAGSGIEQHEPDAPGTDAAIDAPPDGPCTLQTFYRDMDMDGHGDPAASMMACAMPAGTVPNRTDCDDTNPNRHPGLAEVCDAVDNDCNAATSDGCPNGCTAQANAGHVYLLCGNAFNSWTGARNFCNAHGFKLPPVEDAAQNEYLRLRAVSFFGDNIWLGGSDAVEGTWVWDATAAQFWAGPAAPTGMPVGGRYTNWESGEPNDSGGEDCVELRTTGLWNDEDCTNARPYVCYK